jgi:hypothetical protein
MKAPRGPEWDNMRAWEPKTKKGALWKLWKKAPKGAPGGPERGSKGSHGAPRKGKEEWEEDDIKEWGPQRRPLGAAKKTLESLKRDPGRDHKAWERGSKGTAGESGKRKRGMGKVRRNQIMGAPMKAPGSLERDQRRDLKGTPRKLEKELQRGFLEGLKRDSKGTAGESGKRKRGMEKGRRNQIMGAPMKAPWSPGKSPTGARERT